MALLLFSDYDHKNLIRHNGIPAWADTVQYGYRSVVYVLNNDIHDKITIGEGPGTFYAVQWLAKNKN